MRSRLEKWSQLIFVGLAFLSAWSVFMHPTWLAAGGSNYNWRLFETWVEAGRRSIVWYGQFPLWNPWTCGGQVYLANPQSLVTAPTFILPLIFGTAIGLKLQIVAYLFFAYDGMFRLARKAGLELPGAFLASVTFGAGGWLALHISVGHCTFQGAALFPYLLLFYLKALDEWEWVIPLGAIAAWIVALGGTSTPPMAIVLLTVVSTVDVIKKRSPRPYLLLAVAAVAGFVIGAIRMLPAFEFAIDHPRHLFETDANGVLDFLRGLYGWMGVEPVGGKRYWFHEYGLRLSYLTPPLIIWSLKLKPMRRWWLVALIGGLIFAGSAIPFGPWWMLKHLPLFRDLRVPSRYGILMALSLPIVCGAAFDDLLKRLANPTTRKRVAIAVVSLALVDGLIYDYFRFRKVFDTPMQPARQEGYRFFHVVGDWSSMLYHVMRGPGAIGCDEEAPLQRPVRLDEGDVPQAKLLDPSAGQVKAVRWTPNRIEVDVALERPTQVWVNMNWNEHWKVNVGRVLMVGEKHKRDVRGGQLAVDMPAGTETIVLRYRPTSFIAGAAISGVGGPVCLALFWWARRRRRLYPAKQQ
jgi:hypothetical protein